jgi:p-aminobenzoyl-glutamate transporter AbgT
MRKQSEQIPIAEDEVQKEVQKMLPPKRLKVFRAIVLLIVADGLLVFLWPDPNKPQSAQWFIAVTMVPMLVLLIYMPKLVTLIARERISAKKLSSSQERS